ncbi:MAG: hypothetical protein AB8V10_05790 [Francisella endosymbiont of Hyalomma asiaticum]
MIILLTKYNYPLITKDKVFKNIFEQAENLRRINNQKKYFCSILENIRF